MVAYLVSAHRTSSILAIDADPNSCLADNLGIRGARSIVGICEDVSKTMDKIPAGMTKERYIEMQVQESLIEANGFDLLVMGRPEGPGCYCYVNNLLRNMISRITRNYDFVVIDNAAGMEHISRRTTSEMNKLVLVSDYSVPGVRSTKKIYELAKELKIKIGGAYLIVNKASGSIEALEAEVRRTGLEYIGSVPYDRGLVEWNISDKPIFEFKDREIKDTIQNIFENMMKGKNADRVSERKV